MKKRTRDFSKYSEKYLNDIESKYYPLKEFATNQNNATISQIKKLIKLIENNSSETTIDKYISKYPSLLSLLMRAYNTGHHRSWIIPKRIIKTKAKSEDRGMIPDFIMGGTRTAGEHWYIVELKGTKLKWFKNAKGRLVFSSEINSGINQLIEYLDYCVRNQSFFRDEFNLLNFTNIKGILIAGRKSEFQTNVRKQRLKGKWENILGGSIILMTYDSFKEQLQYTLNAFEQNKNLPKPEDSPLLR